MPTYKRKMMCNECPFRAAAAHGWLGPHTPEQFDGAARNDEPLICHLDIRDMKDDDQTDEEIELTGQQCVGAIRYMSLHFKRSVDPIRAAYQDKLKTKPDRPVIPARTFIEHHRSDIYGKPIDRPDRDETDRDVGGD